VAEILEALTVSRGRRAIAVCCVPSTALLFLNGGYVEYPIMTVRPGDRVLIRGGSRIPVEGKVLSGSSAVEEAAITGEPLPQEKCPAVRLAGYLVYFALGAALLTFLITHNARSTISVIIVAGACGSPLERHWPFSAQWVALRGREQSLKAVCILSCWHESIRCCWTRPAHLS